MPLSIWIPINLHDVIFNKCLVNVIPHDRDECRSLWCFFRLLTCYCFVFFSIVLMLFFFYVLILKLGIYFFISFFFFFFCNWSKCGAGADKDPSDQTLNEDQPSHAWVFHFDLNFFDFRGRFNEICVLVSLQNQRRRWTRHHRRRWIFIITFFFFF